MQSSEEKRPLGLKPRVFCRTDAALKGRSSTVVYSEFFRRVWSRGLRQTRRPLRVERWKCQASRNEISSNRYTCAGLGVMKLAEVRLQEGESIENALRRFKRKVQTEDIIKEVKRHSYYLKPGAKRRVKEALARKRARKKVRREPD